MGAQIPFVAKRIVIDVRVFICISFFAFVSCFSAHGQLLELGNKWIYDYRDYSVLNGSYTEKIDSIEVVSDTVINGILYFKLIASEPHPCGIFSTIEYMRQENEQVFLLNGNLQDEHLVLDFSDQSAYNMVFESDWSDAEIETTVLNDSTVSEIFPGGDQIDLTYQRILNNLSFDDDTEFKLSEEIGYIQYGLLLPAIGIGLCDVYQSVNLRCKVSASDTIRLTALDCYESSITSSAVELDQKRPIIYPNPSRGIVYFKGDFKVIAVQNLSGTSMKLKGAGNSIDISDFPKGFYFISLMKVGDHTIQTHKIVRI